MQQKCPFWRAGPAKNENSGTASPYVFGLVRDASPKFFLSDTYLHGAVACAKYAVDGTVNARVPSSNTSSFPAVFTKSASNVSINVW